MAGPSTRRPPDRGWRPRSLRPTVGEVNRCGRVVGAVFGAGLLAVALASCSLAPQPTVTRLPPAPVGASSIPTVTVPAPSVVPVTPSSVPSTSASADVGGTSGEPLTCADGESKTISGSEQIVRVTGSCAELSVSGSAMTVDATAASIGTLSVAGDRVRVDAASITVLSVQGNDGVLTSAASIGSVDLRGDRTQVTVAGTISSVAIRGQDNTVRAGGGVGDRTIEGRDNQVG